MRELIVVIRSLKRSRGFFIAAVLSLALAIGAGITGFGVLDAIRFRALPFPHADRLVMISETPKGGCPTPCSVDYLSFALLRAHRFQSIDALSSFGEYPKSAKAFGSGGDQFGVATSLVSRPLFDMLGAKPAIGRVFSDDEDKLGAAPAMVISYDLWTTYFAGDPSVVGKTYRLSEEPFTVIGIMRPGFNFESQTQVWLSASRYLDPRTGTSARTTFVMARLIPGATMQQLAGELRTLEAAANAERPEKARTTFTVAPLRDRYIAAAHSHDLIFAAIVGAILIIGCANVASLVLVRAIRRRRSLAVRSALGASRARLVRLLAVENGLLSAAGLMLGLVLAWSSLRLLQSSTVLQGGGRVAGMEYRLDGRAVAFAVALSALITLVLSVAPVRLLVTADLETTLREGGIAATGSRGGNRVHQLFVVTQTACAVALLIATGVMARAMAHFAGVPLGYDATHVISMLVAPVHSARSKASYLPTDERVLADLSAIPGVEAAAVRMQAPFAAVKPPPPGVTIVARDAYDSRMSLDNGRLVDVALQPRSAFGVSPDYFRALGIRFIAGRSFTASDDESSSAVAIVNEWAARHWWPNQNAVGHTFSIDTTLGVRAVVTVVGVVADNLAGDESVLLAQDGPEVYRPFRQANYWISTFYVRARETSPSLVATVQRTIMKGVPASGPARGGWLAGEIRAQVQSIGANTAQVGGFAIIGLLLAVTGLYGVVSYVVEQRAREFGIRAALGADAARLRRMVLSSAALLAVAGVAAGIALAALLTRLLKDLLYGTPPGDLLVHGGVALVALVVALLAAYVPARRASRVDPATALRAQ